MENKRIRILENLSPDQARQYFTVPNTSESSVKLNQNLACFIVFLLQVLDDEALSFSTNPKSLYARLQKKLSCLHSFLGDTPFQCSELGDTMNLLIEFETVANETGSFIYSCVSATSKKMRKNKFYTGIKSLLIKIDMFMNGQIKAHCIKKLPKIETSRTNHLSSLFIIGSLLEDLQGLINDQCDINLDDIRDQSNTLITELISFLAFFKYIEKSQVTHANDELQNSLIHFIDATHEAEYLINAHTGGHIPSWYLNLRIPFIVQKIQNISARIQNIEIHRVKEEELEALRYPEPDASIVVGYENIREPVLAYLVGGSTTLQYISVLGMSGIGKSTMAKKVYNDQVVRDCFDVHVWCTVSQTYDMKKVLHEIAKSLPRKSGKDEILNYESLALRIYQTLFGRKYLIIVDDVWDSCVWDDLRRCFPNDGNGSRILLTSQIKDSAPAGSIFHQVPLLTNSQCYELLMKKVSIEESLPSGILDIAQRIASKCHGLPLTVVVVAGILANVGRDESAWRNVERNMDMYISDDSSIHILELSYKYLPNHLKPCFLFVRCSFFSKDVRVRDLIPLWISNGFVQKEENKSKEGIAEEYLWELINRSLLIIKTRGSDGGIRSCELHDLIDDMCRRICRTEKFYCDFDQFPPFHYSKHLYIGFRVKPSNICSISALQGRSVSGFTSALGHSVMQMPLLRVITDQESPIDEKRIDGLVHLRYFSSYVRIAQLPEGLCKLVNLEYLHLHASHYKVEVPSTILKMVKLREIRIASQVIFLKICDISQIRNNINSLSRIRIRNREEDDILKCSPHLKKLKCICEGLFPDLSSLTHLKSLSISVFDSPRLKGELAEISFPSTLKKLTLSGTKLPWEESSVVGKLPNLEVLKLLYDAFLGNEWKTRDDEFQELKFLKIHNIFSLRKWTSCKEHFPKLEHLVMEHVRVEIPLEFSYSDTLHTIQVCNCGDVVHSSAELIREEQQDLGNADFKVITQGFDMRDRVAPSPRREDDKSKTSMELEEGEDVFTISVEGSMDVKESQLGSSSSICAGCNSGHGTLITAMGSYWHLECFCCHACKQPIHDVKFTHDSEELPYHDSCYEAVHHPKCDVCKDFVPTNADGDYIYQLYKLWNLKYCRSHQTDGTPRCCSCLRFEPLDSTHLILDDGRTLCLECKESSIIIMNTEECEPLYTEIQDYFQGLNIKMKQDITVVLVDRQAMDEATKEEGHDSYLSYSKDWEGDVRSRVSSNTTDDSKVINSILVLYGRPRILTGYSIAYRMMEAWLYLEGYQNLNFKVRSCICQLSGHMWLEHEINSSSSQKGELSEFEKKLGEYTKYWIENNTRAVYRDIFWECKKAVDEYGFKHTVDHIRRYRTFPS